MAVPPERASGNCALSLKWKGTSSIKALGTDDEQVANGIRRDAEEQLASIRRGESGLALKLPADGHSIVDVPFGSEEIGHLIERTIDDRARAKGASRAYATSWSSTFAARIVGTVCASCPRPPMTEPRFVLNVVVRRCWVTTGTFGGTEMAKMETPHPNRHDADERRPTAVNLPIRSSSGKMRA